MRHTFTKTLGMVTENLELNIEEKWIYVFYTRGKVEKTAYILKNSDKTIEAYISSFLEENHISEDLKIEIKKFISADNQKKETDWHKFSVFLIKTLSVNIVVCFMLGLAIFAGYKTGAAGDAKFNLYPLFTIIGVLLGLILGGYICYVIMKNYMKQDEINEKKIHSNLLGASYGGMISYMKKKDNPKE